jgi:hypothetical protein
VITSNVTSHLLVILALCSYFSFPLLSCIRTRLHIFSLSSLYFPEYPQFLAFPSSSRSTHLFCLWRVPSSSGI